jgi:hypothetical protein
MAHTGDDGRRPERPVRGHLPRRSDCGGEHRRLAAPQWGSCCSKDSKKAAPFGAASLSSNAERAIRCRHALRRLRSPWQPRSNHSATPLTLSSGCARRVHAVCRQIVSIRFVLGHGEDFSFTVARRHHGCFLGSRLCTSPPLSMPIAMAHASHGTGRVDGGLNG